MNKNNLLEIAIKASIDAGAAIMEIYDTDFAVQTKIDNSPITIADKKAHQLIYDQLLPTNIPVLSEEGDSISYETRKNWEYLWVVDPLDGTKEFVKRNGEFTVNIALIHNSTPIMGIIYIPVEQSLYFASDHIGSFKLSNINNKAMTLKSILKIATKLPSIPETNFYKIVTSRSFLNTETKDYIESINNSNIRQIAVGSSIKFCWLAEGKAQLYPRFGPTMEWDTAAGHAILKYAGGKLLRMHSDDELRYNRENLLNPNFIASK